MPGAVQIQGTASAEESQKSQQIKQTRATRRNNSVGYATSLELQQRKWLQNPGALDRSPMLTAPLRYARHTDAALLSLSVLMSGVTSTNTK